MLAGDRYLDVIEASTAQAFSIGALKPCRRSCSTDGCSCSAPSPKVSSSRRSRERAVGGAAGTRPSTSSARRASAGCSDERYARTSHALAVDGRVGPVDPRRRAGSGRARLARRGARRRACQLLDRHNRDCAGDRRRGSGVSTMRARGRCRRRRSSSCGSFALPGWHEVALWWPERRVLVVRRRPRDGGFYTGAAGPPASTVAAADPRGGGCADYDPEHLLVGHGRGCTAVRRPCGARGTRRDLPITALPGAGSSTRAPTLPPRRQAPSPSGGCGRPGRTSRGGATSPASLHLRVERLGERRGAERRARPAPRARRRRASSAGAATRPAERISSSICSGGSSCPHSEPAAREIDSFISVPPRSFTPAASASPTPSGPSLTHEAWMFVIHGMQREPRDRVHEQRLAERRPAARATLQVDRRLHVHERQRHELGEAARSPLLLAARSRWRAQLRGPLDVAEHDRHVRAQADAVRGVVHLEPLVGRHLVGADHRAHLVVEDLRGRARQRAEADVAQPRRGTSLEREPERRRALPDLERRERVHVHARAPRP